MRHTLVLLLFTLTIFVVESKDVGIFYWTWFPQAWGFGTWGTPAIGKYDSAASNVIDQHTEWLRDAGIDFVLIDWSNNCLPYGDPNNPNFLENNTLAFANRQAERRQAGMSYIQFSVMLGDCGHPEYLQDGTIWRKAEQVNQWFLRDPRFNPLYWRYRTVPFAGLFAITVEQQAEGFNHAAFWTRVIGAGLSGRGLVGANFSSRYMTYEDRWEPVPSYDSLYPQYTQHTIQVACRGPGGWDDPNHRRCRDNGNTFRDWWTIATQRNVDLAIVHSFNQWGGPGEEKDEECSTDIEPMQGGHGDSYLQLLKSEVQKFKQS